MDMSPGRSSGLAKTILQCTVKGGRRHGRQTKRWGDNIKEWTGRQTKRWEDNIKEWTGLGRQRKRWEDSFREWTGVEFAKSKRAVENRQKWRKPVVKSSVVPQRPPRLRDG